MERMRKVLFLFFFPSVVRGEFVYSYFELLGFLFLFVFFFFSFLPSGGSFKACSVGFRNLSLRVDYTGTRSPHHNMLLMPPYKACVFLLLCRIQHILQML